MWYQLRRICCISLVLVCFIDFSFLGSSSDTHFSFDLTSVPNKLIDIEEFDPLARSPEVQDSLSEDSAYNCDDFATTPTALKNENKCQPSFILHASKYAVCAQEAEVNSNFAEAFEMYKKAIDMLIQGIQSNTISVIFYKIM